MNGCSNTDTPTDTRPFSSALHLRDGPQPAALLGKSNAAIALRAAITELATRHPITALVVGTAGVGRRQVASAIHRESPYADRPMRYIDCHETTPMGLDAMLSAHGVEDRLEPTTSNLPTDTGLLVIDGVQCLARSSQSRLVSQVRHIKENARQGTVHTALILIVHDGIDSALASGTLDQTLYDALADDMLTVPELADRQQDVLGIARHFVEALNADLGDSKHLSDELERRLLGYNWPGNVQELKFLIHELYTRAGSGAVIDVDPTLAPMLLSDEQRAIRDTVGTSFWDMQRALLLETLSSVGGDKQKAAETLGISLKTLYNRLRDYR